ncbi:EAL domain-containing protein [Salmonella enterica subsp. enterica serovar Newport]|nr:EAL domain-containing protein [Salmonella enterica]EEK2703122.1 EAL domain-containing protein [Salmonella enterica subsp. enterica serovar Newport]
MSENLYLSDDILSAIHLPESVMIAGEEHLSACCLVGMKAEPLVNLQTGAVVGHEFLSLLPSGVCSESFFRDQPATVLMELFMLQLLLSTRLTSGYRFFNLPVRVLLRPRLCEVLYSSNLTGIMIEIQDPASLPRLSLMQLSRLRHHLHSFRQAGVRIYVDDVIPGLIPELSAMALPLSGLKVSRELFQSQSQSQSQCHDLLAWYALTETEGETGRFLVAEGIETPEQSLLAALAGFTHGQGWLWPTKRWQFV